MNLNILYVPKCPRTDLGTNEVTTTKRFKNLYLHCKVYTYPTPSGGTKLESLCYSTIAQRGNEERGKEEVFIHPDLHISLGTYRPM